MRYPFGTLSIWAYFDGEYYLGVAESGYEDYSPAYFPLYLLLVCGVATLIDSPIFRGALSTVGVSVSLAAFLVALYFVYRISEEGWGVRAAEGGRAFPILLLHQLLLQGGLHREPVPGAFCRGRVYPMRECMLLFDAFATENGTIRGG